MKHRVEACLKIWTAAGVTVTRRGLALHITGLDELPHWWRDWTIANHHHLVAILPDQDAPPAPERKPLWEDQGVAWNALSAPVDRERPRQPVMLSDRRLQMLERLRQFAEL